MAITLANINTLVNDRRRDTSSNSIDMTGDGFRACNSVLDIWNQQHEWEFQIDKQTINYNQGITYYTLNSNFKAPIDLKRIKNPRDKEYALVMPGNFDSETLKTKRFAFPTQAQSQKLRIKDTEGGQAVLHTMSNYNQNGVWVGATAISNVATDAYEAFDFTSSISFDYSGTSGTLTNSTMNLVDLRRFKNRSNVYLNVFLPSVTNFTSVTLRFGSSATSYYTVAATTDYLGDSIVAGQWAKLKFAWSNLTTVGTPNEVAINYIQIIITYSVNPSMTGCRVENLFVSENVPIELEYYTNEMVTDSGIKTQHFTDSADTDDNPLWSGKWDWVNEAFVNSVIEIIFWMTGEYEDLTIAQTKVVDIVTSLKTKLPSRRRYPESNIRISLN